MAQAPAAPVHSQVPVAPQPKAYAATPAPGPLQVTLLNPRSARQDKAFICQ